MKILKTTAIALSLIASTASAEYIPSVDLDKDPIDSSGYSTISWNQISGYIAGVEMACNNDVCVPHLLLVDTELGYFRVNAESDVKYITGTELIINIDIRGIE